MQVVGRGLIWDAATCTDGRAAASFVALCAAADGSLYASFRRGSSKDSTDGNATICRSDDEGRTWQVVCDGLRTEHASCHRQLVTASLYEAEPGRLGCFATLFETREDSRLYDSSGDALLPSWLVLADSTDRGVSWGDYRVLDTQGLPGCSATGSTAMLADGRVVLPFESYGTRPGSEERVHAACAFLLGPERGPGDPVVIASDPQRRVYYWDQRVALCPLRATPVAMFWTYDRRSEQDLPIGIAWGSADGLSWEQPSATGLAGQISQPIPLPDGRLAAFYVHRHAPPSMRLALSGDGGRTWDPDDELVVYDAAADAAGRGDGSYTDYWDEMFTWTFGHPAGLVLPGGDLLLAYYAGLSPEHLSIHWARVRARAGSSR
ncbi:MAG: sialidase family protein [Armatimonadota bacterium]